MHVFGLRVTEILLVSRTQVLSWQSKRGSSDECFSFLLQNCLRPITVARLVVDNSRCVWGVVIWMKRREPFLCGAVGGSRVSTLLSWMHRDSSHCGEGCTFFSYSTSNVGKDMSVQSNL